MESYKLEDFNKNDSFKSTNTEDESNDDEQIWMKDFVNNFFPNWKLNPSISEGVYNKYRQTLFKHTGFLPSIIFSEQALAIFYQMIDLQYADFFLPVALELIHLFYIRNEKIDLTPLQNIFIHLKEIILDAPDDIKNQILVVVGCSINHSENIRNQIYSLFDADFLSFLLKSNSDLADPISILIHGYSKSEEDLERCLSLLDLSLQLLYNSLIIKSDEEDSIQKCLILNRLTFNRSLSSTYNICLNMEKFNPNPAVEFIYDRKIDQLFNLILQDQKNFNDRFLNMILFLYDHVNLISNQNAFDILDDVEESKPRFPNLDYTVFINFIVENSQKDPKKAGEDSKNCIELSEGILNKQFNVLTHLFATFRKQFFEYLMKNKLMESYIALIHNGQYKLKVKTMSSLRKFLENGTIDFFDYCFRMNLPSILIRLIDVETPNLSIQIMRCLNLLLKNADKLQCPIEAQMPMISCFKTDVNEDEIAEINGIQDELIIFNSYAEAIIRSQNNEST